VGCGVVLLGYKPGLWIGQGKRNVDRGLSHLFFAQMLFSLDFLSIFAIKLVS